MLYIIFILTMVNAVMPQYHVINEFRVSLGGGVVLSYWDVAISLGVLWALFRGGEAQADHPPDRTPPLLLAIYVLYGVSTVAGCIGMLREGGDWKYKITALREWLAVVGAVLYRLSPAR